MNLDLDETHDPRARSWVESANEASSDFPIQNLPFGRFRRNSGDAWRIGVAIGDMVLDLARTGLVDEIDMNSLMARGPVARKALRRALFEGLMQGSPVEKAWRPAVTPIAAVELGLPCHIGDYTDFYVGIHHASSVGRLFRPDNPLLPNYKWVPIGYHGRASTIRPSGHSFPRPKGQVKGPTGEDPRLSLSQRLDFELELGIFVGKPNEMGTSISMESAEDHVFGLGLFNDWSARDFQAWEYQPLGPFLSKNFASTVSPWIVTLEALMPFRKAFSRPEEDPQPLGYLTSARNAIQGAIDIDLEVRLQTQRMRDWGQRGEVISRSNYADAAYWTMAQLIAHHTVNGCELNAGDLLGTGTLSGPIGSQAGSLLELTDGGKRILRLSSGENRLFLLDGDSIELAGRCRKEGFRSIGFGPCIASVADSAWQPAASQGTSTGVGQMAGG
ncbi:fumarylacetoacetase [Roseateles violae]|uniref:fumarylacetoacetase n=1 Tax=Roseateles violae TaxID=3058042 RepID=A0ABT8DWM9_9BURK|nr:fumarylacetoacetase [Pelomonas sp. PFR6]MDN3922551.1 fumarylacetoacetase [Pelomonas sp. PFR6]